MLGNTHISLESVTSTNTHARELLQSGAAEGTVVTASHQTAGRGRLDRQWIDAPGQSFIGSYILYPERPFDEWGGLPLLTGIAVLRAIQSLVPIDLHLKWPNDILVGEKKICGILVESGMMGSQPWAIIGVGINLNQQVFEGSYRLPPTSILLEAGKLTAAQEVLAPLSNELKRMYDLWSKHGTASIIEAWKGKSRMLGKHVEISIAGGGSQIVKALDVAESGALRVQNPDGSISEVFAGDITYPTIDTKR